MNLIDVESKSSVRIDNFVEFHPCGNKPPLIIVHGQQANIYIKGLIENDQPFYGYLHPGSDGEEICFTSVAQMAKAYLDQLLLHKPKGPYLLGGFSFGGILAFEMAVQLRKLGHEIPLLALIDTSSPTNREYFPTHGNFFKIIKSTILAPIVMGVLNTGRQSLCQFYIRFNKPIPLGLRNHYILSKYKKLVKSYQPEKFDGDILLFRASENRSLSRCLGWESFANNIKVVSIEGNHLTTVGEKKIFESIYSEIKKYFCA
jgi:thioesterase domain-containing protein